jgi:hypothetical protein
MKPEQQTKDLDFLLGQLERRYLQPAPTAPAGACQIRKVLQNAQKIDCLRWPLDPHPPRRAPSLLPDPQTGIRSKRDNCTRLAGRLGELSAGWTTAGVYLAKIVKKYETIASRLVHWLEKNIPEGLTVFDLPVTHQRKIRTVNGLERVSEEVKRRTRVVGIFPNEAFCLQLVSAILVENDEKWQIRKKYFTFEEESRSPWQSP